MKKKILAIYDTEPEYAEHLIHYFNHKEKGYLETRIFTNQTSLLEFLENNIIDILLIAESIFFELCEKQKIKNIFLLSEENFVRETGNEVYIYKFQSAKEIWRQISSYIEENEETFKNPFSAVKKETSLIGIFSPYQGSEKTNFSLAFGHKIAKIRRTLYINMEAFPGIEMPYKKDIKSLTDIIYNIHENRNWIEQIDSILYSQQELDFIFPVNHFLDLLEIKVSDIYSLKKELSKIYEIIILDLGFFSEELFSILELCQKIYMPIREDKVSEIKKEMLLKNLRMEGKEKFFEDFVPIIISEDRNIENFAEEFIKREFL